MGTINEPGYNLIISVGSCSHEPAMGSKQYDDMTLHSKSESENDM